MRHQEERKVPGIGQTSSPNTVEHCQSCCVNLCGFASSANRAAEQRRAAQDATHRRRKERHATSSPIFSSLLHAMFTTLSFTLFSQIIQGLFEQRKGSERFARSFKVEILVNLHFTSVSHYNRTSHLKSYLRSILNLFKQING